MWKLLAPGVGLVDFLTPEMKIVKRRDFLRMQFLN
jgi:hypothetical protein